MIDAGIERIGDLQRSRTKGLVDGGNPLADSVGEFLPTGVDERGDVGDALVDRVDHFLAALGKRLGDVHDARG